MRPWVVAAAMVSQEQESLPLAVYELRLLRCSLTPSALVSVDQGVGVEEQEQVKKSGDTLSHGIQTVVQQVESGEYVQALALDPLLMLLGDAPAGFTQEASACYSALEARIAAFLSGRDVKEDAPGSTCSAEELQARAILALAVGIAALLNFTQANKTGPVPECSAFPLQKLWKHVKVEDGEWDAWARKELMADGCDFLGKFSLPQYLILAKLLLVATTESNTTLGEHWEPLSKTWWACRTLLAQQHILAERAASLLASLESLTEKALNRFGTAVAVQGLGWKDNLYPGEEKVIAATALLEAGLVQHAYSHVDKARFYFEQSKLACDLHLSVTGALGFRTIHQVDAKAQLVLVAKSLIDGEADSSDNLRQASDDDSFLSLQKQKAGQSEILLAPRVGNAVKDAGIPTGMDADGGDPRKALKAIEQALVLTECLHIQKNSPEDELKSWEMAPFIEAVDTQQLSPPMVRAWCDLLRIQWERKRHRTQERSLSMMEHLIDQVRKSSTKASQRMCYAFSVSFPTQSALSKEYAEMMVACGLVGEALRMFEELELWNNLIDCYSLLGKKAAASDLIQDRLKSQPNDPRLWCSLGDVTLNEECYSKAWEVSGFHFARAQRSLGRAAYNRGEFRKSIDHWNTALALNPLFPDGWFALGSAALKAKELDVAVQAFTRAVQLDPDNGDCWNNIAAINLHREKYKESFKAFEQALKFKRGSWQLWENFAQVALKVREFGRASEALFNVLNLSNDKRVDLVSLTKLVEEVEARTLSDDQEATAASDTPPTSGEHNSEGATVKHSQLLLQNVGKLLTRVVSRGQSGGDAWGLLARWHRAKGDLAMSAEASLKQTRAYQGNDWQQNKEGFQKLANASLQLCQTYLDLSSAQQGFGKSELSSARMHLRNTMKKADRFKCCEEHLALESCLERVEGRLQQLQNTP